MDPVVLSKPGNVRLEVLPPLALYVHIPWCVRKCPYCDFNSHERNGELPEREYVGKLINDLEDLLPAVWGRRIVSVFIGGGTPSLFSPDAIDALLSAIRARVQVEPSAEITLEANPGTAEAALLAGFRQAGVNRISVGVQSFDDRMLAALGRIHGADEARRAVAVALESFDNVNLDLMYGLPGQTLAMARSDIEEAVRLGAPHVSAYQLTIEPNTVFWSKPPQLPQHDESADMQLAAEEVLCAAGYGHYETSASARPSAGGTSSTSCFKYSSRERPLDHQQPKLRLEPAHGGEAACLSARREHAMARHHDREGIAGERHAYLARRAGLVQLRCDFAVRGSAAAGNA